jgi:hypothetical protein
MEQDGMDLDSSASTQDMSISNDSNSALNTAERYAEQLKGKSVSFMANIASLYATEEAKNPKPRQYVPLEGATADRATAKIMTDADRDRMRAMFQTKTADGSVRDLDLKNPEDFKIMAKNTGTTIPVPLGDIQDVQNARISIRASDHFVKDTFKKQMLYLHINQGEMAYQNSLKVEHLDYLALLPLLNIPVIPSPLYAGLHRHFVSPIMDSFDIISFYSLVLKIIFTSDDLVKTRKKDISIMIANAIAGRKNQDFLDLLQLIIYKPEYSELEVHRTEIVNGMSNPQANITDLLDTFSKKMEVNIIDVKREGLFKTYDVEGIFSKVVEEGEEKKEAEKPKYSHDMLEFRKKLMDIWTESFEKEWEKLHFSVDEGKSRDPPIEEYSDFFYQRTFELLHFYELTIVYLLAIAGYVNFDVVTAVKTQPSKPIIEAINPLIMKAIFENRAKFHEYRSTLTNTFKFDKASFEMQTKDFMSLKEIEMFKAMYNYKIDAKVEVADLLNRRTQYFAPMIANKSDQPEPMQN